MKELKLDLGCGQHPALGHEGVDKCPSLPIAHHVDLLRFPLPWNDSSVDAIRCSHFIEHVPAREVTLDDLIASSEPRYVTLRGIEPSSDRLRPDMIGQDMLLAFFDECWRILKPAGVVELVWPALQTNRAFKDPTHRRFIPLETMNYLNATWRTQNGLNHYHAKCDFTCRPGYSPTPRTWSDSVDYHVWLTVVK